MNILIPNSWLKDFLETNASPKEFAHAMSLSSVSIERIEKVDDDYIYDIEVTTNRPDLMSVEGIAREASAVLPQAGFKALYRNRVNDKTTTSPSSPMLAIKNEKTLVNRIVAVVMDVTIAKSPQFVQDRLEKTGIRSINNVVDTTNYIMREVGHPSHVFDYDRIPNKTLIIRSSKKGEKIVTLDEKEHLLLGGDIVADDGDGNIIDLLGVMGTANSVVTPDTKRIVLFLDNNNPHILRNTSMSLGIRSEAAVLNEKGVDPELMIPTLQRGVELLKKYARGKVVSDVIDIYPNKPANKTVSTTFSFINKLIGIEISRKTVTQILKDLEFEVEEKGDLLTVRVPSKRANDIEIAEDIVEEVARVYGYHKIPNSLPPSTSQAFFHQDKSEFYWVGKIKEAFKYWGFNETYTYSMVSEELFDGPIENAVKLKNPLTEDRAFMRSSLVPSLIEAASQNKNRDILRLFEISNVYIKREKDLPEENLHLAILIQEKTKNFYFGKGIVEQIAKILGLEKFVFKLNENEVNEINIYYKDKKVGVIDIDENILIEIELSYLLANAKSTKKYTEPPKFPPVIEDIRVELPKAVPFVDIVKAIKEVSSLIYDVRILDEYKDKKTTYRVLFLSKEKSLNNEEVAPIREKVFQNLKEKFNAIIG